MCNGFLERFLSEIKIKDDERIGVLARSDGVSSTSSQFTGVVCSQFQRKLIGRGNLKLVQTVAGTFVTA